MHTKNDKRLVESQRFDTKGKSDLSTKKKLTDDQAAAKVIAVDAKCIYQVKRNRRGQMFNPKDHALNDKSKSDNGLEFKFKLVGKSSFDFYLDFLKTGHDRYIICAERELS